MLTPQDRAWLDRYENDATTQEAETVREAGRLIRRAMDASAYGTSFDDRHASLDAAIYRYIIESRAGVAA